MNGLGTFRVRAAFVTLKTFFKMMKITVDDSYEQMSLIAANDLLALIQSKKNPVLCVASGDSPMGMYKELIKQVKEKDIDVSDWSFVGLDEWVGMNANDEGSCRFHLDNQLFHPLKVPENNISFFDGRANDLENECGRIENFISRHGGIDAAIVGLGMNGHIGMNEPGTDPSLRSHITDIDSITQQVGQKYFKEKRELSKGITLGLANLMEARNVFLLVSGSKKAAILKKVLEEEISQQLPAGLLRNHQNLSVYLDLEAASLLQMK